MYINIDKKYKRYASFTKILLYKCVDSSDANIADLDAMSNNNMFLCNNMTKSLLFKDRTTFQRNCTLIAIIALSILYYAQKKCFNIVQKVNT